MLSSGRGRGWRWWCMRFQPVGCSGACGNGWDLPGEGVQCREVLNTVVGMGRNRFGQMPDLWTRWGKERVGRIERVALKHNITNVKLDQFSSVQSLSHVRLSATPWINHSMPGLPVHHQLPESTETHVHRVGDANSSSLVPFSSCSQSLPASGSFPMSQLFQWKFALWLRELRSDALWPHREVG